MFLTSPVIQIVKQTAKAQSISPWLLSLGLVFSVATQLRLPGLPLGLGEVLLLLWLPTTLVSGQNWRNPALTGVLSLIIVGALLLGAGYFLTAYPEGQLRPPALHDTLAYVFCAVLVINYARLTDKYENSLPAMLLWAFLLSALLALVLGVIVRDWSGIDAVWRDPPYRWKHLSSNPNQFALLALPLPFLALHLILQTPKKSIFLLSLIAGLLALALGWYGQSDALMLAWIGGGLVALLPLLTNRPGKVFLPVSGKNRSVYAIRIYALLIILMMAASAWQWKDKLAGVSAGVDAGARSPQCPSMAEYNQASVRFCLWRNALGVIEYAPLTGLGPGPHSGIVKPFDGWEAHNTLLDWGSQTGLFGMGALLAYWLWVLWEVMRRHRYELVAMLLALYCFSMFHFVLRQPLFWIIPLLALALAVRSTLSADPPGES